MVFILLSCSSNSTIIGKPACVCPTACTGVIHYSTSQDAYTDIQTHRPLQMHLLDKHTQFSVHLIVHSVSFKANLQVRSSRGPCSAEFCCRPLISLTLLLPKAERALKPGRPLSQCCQDMLLQFYRRRHSLGERAGRARESSFVSIQMEDYPDQKSYIAIRLEYHLNELSLIRPN